MRIVAGEFRGRRLTGPPSTSVRPTADRTREALFSILGDVTGLRVLDLFGGTGALALEALSRGAERAVIVERDRRTLAVARKNCEELLGEGGTRVELVRGEALRELAAARHGKFDLVFVDPPYADAAGLATELNGLLPQALEQGARVVVETDRRNDMTLAPPLSLVSEHRYGDTLLRIYESR